DRRQAAEGARRSRAACRRRVGKMAEAIAWRPARLKRTRDLTQDIRLFEIEPSGGFVVPTPGSHFNFTVHINGRPDVRSYSAVGPCQDGLYRIAVKLLGDTRGGSAYMWSLQPGGQLTMSTPGNHFELNRHAPEYLLIAGGIGITPIFTMTLALAHAGAKFRLLYACRRRQDLALADELSRAIGDRLGIFIDEDGGRIDLDGEIAKLAPGGELYVCGPIGMLEAAKRAWAASGRPVDQLRFETFGNSGRFASETFTVRIPRLGREIVVSAHETMLDALEAAGIDMIFDCRRGECGLCALPILSVDGTVDHRDVFFSDDEKASNAKLCTCVSRVVGGSITVDTGDRVGGSSRRLAHSPPEPQRAQHDQRADDGGDHVAQRYGDLVEARPDPEQAEQQPSDDRTDEAERKIAQQAEALALPGDQPPREAAADEPDDDPDDDVVE